MGIFDSRDCAVARKMVLEGLEKEICLLADQVIRMEKLYRLLGDEFTDREINLAIDSLKKKKLLLQIGEEILFLAVPRNFPKVGKYLPFWLGLIETDKKHI